jgi:RHS repeat-associated protein
VLKYRLENQIKQGEIAEDFRSRQHPSCDLLSKPRIEVRIYWSDGQLAYRDTTTYFDHRDLFGTERMRTDPTGAVVSSYSSLPWGDGYVPNETDPGGTAQVNEHYALLEHDAESGTDHAQFRQYSNIQGRWMSPDPYYGSYRPWNPQSFNRYTYGMNRPLSSTDPTGMDDSIGGCDSPESRSGGVHAHDCEGGDPNGGGGGDAGGTAPSDPRPCIANCNGGTPPPPDPGPTPPPPPDPDPSPDPGGCGVFCDPTSPQGPSGSGGTVNRTTQPKSPARQQCEANANQSYNTAMACANQDALRNWGRDIITSTIGGMAGGCFAGGMPSGGVGCPVGGLVGALGGLVGGTAYGGVDGGFTAMWARDRASEDYASAMQQCSQIQ